MNIFLISRPLSNNPGYTTIIALAETEHQARYIHPVHGVQSTWIPDNNWVDNPNDLNIINLGPASKEMILNYPLKIIGISWQGSV